MFVCIDVGLMADSFGSTLGKLRLLVSDELAAMEDFLEARTCSEGAFISGIVRHLILSGGKRTRPVLHLAACGLLGCEDERRVPIAAALECIHAATLLHDDVVDGSDTRRGVRAARSIWGNKASILVGDFLFAMSFEWVVRCEHSGVLAVLSNASSVVISGEIQQLVYSEKVDISREKYIEIISAKTAALFAAACEAACVLAGAVELGESLRRLGNNFGIVFQILDDVLDYTADASVTGKTSCNDIAQGKVTLPLIIAYEDADSQTREGIRRELAKPAPNVDTVLDCIYSCNAIKKSVEIARHYAVLALQELDASCPDSEFKTALKALLQSATDRHF